MRYRLNQARSVPTIFRRRQFSDIRTDPERAAAPFVKSTDTMPADSVKCQAAKPPGQHPQTSTQLIQWHGVEPFKDLDRALFDFAEKVVDIRNLPERSKTGLEEFLQGPETGRVRRCAHGAKG